MPLDEKKETWMTLTTSISKAFEHGIAVPWTEHHREYEKCLNLLELPSYAFDLKSYWIQYEGDWCIRKAQSKQTLLKSPSLLSTTLHGVNFQERKIWMRAQNQQLLRLTFPTQSCGQLSVAIW